MPGGQAPLGNPRGLLWTGNASRRPRQAPTPAPSKILTIPIELLCMIFEETDLGWVEEMMHYIEWQSPPPLRPGLACLHVCRRWRSAALNHPPLWETIVHAAANRLMPLPRLKFYLKHSRTRPLNIVIRAQNFYWAPELARPVPEGDFPVTQVDDDHVDAVESCQPWTSEHIQVVLEELLPHASRWRLFALDICVGNLDTKVLSLVEAVQAPQLRVFEVLTHLQWKRETLRTIPDPGKETVIRHLRSYLRPSRAHRNRAIFMGSHRTALRLDVFALYTYLPSFGNLTVLELRNSHYICLPRMIYAHIFNSAPRLVSATFMRCYVYDPDFDPQEDEQYDEAQHADDLTMRAPCLEVLRCFDSYMSFFMWKHLEAPQLRDVVISHADLSNLGKWTRNSANGAYVRLEGVRTPFPLMERLVIQECYTEELTNAELRCLARLTQTIEQLVVIQDHYILRAMVGDENIDDQDIWPNLRLLRLGVSNRDLGATAGGYSPKDIMASIGALMIWRLSSRWRATCVIELHSCYFRQVIADGVFDRSVYPNRMYRDLGLSLIHYFKGLVARDEAMDVVDNYDPEVDVLRDMRSFRPLWPPPAGQERPRNVAHLYYIDLLGAPDNRWF